MESTVISSTTWNPIIEALTAQISVAAVIEVLVATIGVCAAFAFMWWGVKKSVRMLMAAFKKGKVSV